MYAMRTKWTHQSKFFPFSVTPFQKGAEMQESKQEVIKVVVFFYKVWETVPTVPSPLYIGLTTM